LKPSETPGMSSFDTFLSLRISWESENCCCCDKGYKINQNKLSPEEYAKLDAQDESLNRWKASLGITAGAPAAPAEGPKVRSASWPRALLSLKVIIWLSDYLMIIRMLI